MSKGSDINVGNIEEDIEIVKSLIEDTKKSLISNTELSQYRKSNRTIAYKALEHLLLDYERQKQINEEHQKINGELREKVKELDTKNDELLKDLYSANCIIADLTDSIPKQNIIEKIEELDRKEQELQNSISEEEREEYEDANISYLLCDIEIRRKVLKELLQEGNK